MITSELKEVCKLFSETIKENKLRPITGLVEIYSTDGVAHLGITDNRTTIVATLENKNDFDNAVISLTDLYKLVKLTTKENITISNKGKYIEVKGDGKYKIPIQVDEMGNDIFLPLEMPDMGDIIEYEGKDFKKALTRNEVGLFTEENHNEFKLYYNKDGRLITTDSITLVCTEGLNLPIGDIQPFVIKQLSNIDGVMKFSNVDGGYRISYNNYEIYIVNKLYDNFPISMVEPFLEDNSSMFPVKAEIDKDVLIKAIKRQDIFRVPFEVPSSIFYIKDNILCLRNKNNSADEELISVNCNMQMKAEVETSVLLEALKNIHNELSLCIGERAIKICDDIGFYIISVMERD